MHWTFQDLEFFSNFYFIHILSGGDHVTLENEVMLQDVDQQKSYVEVCNFRS